MWSLQRWVYKALTVTKWKNKKAYAPFPPENLPSIISLLPSPVPDNSRRKTYDNQTQNIHLLFQIKLLLLLLFYGYHLLIHYSAGRFGLSLLTGLLVRCFAELIYWRHQCHVAAAVSIFAHSNWYPELTSTTFPLASLVALNGRKKF